jgi:hypothetical protein
MRVGYIICILPFIFSSCIQEKDWYLLKSEYFGFKIEFPKEPKYIQQTSVFKYGRQDFNIYTFESESDNDDNLNYFACKTTYPDSFINTYKNRIDQFFNGSIHSSIESVHGKKISDRVVNY